MKKSLLFSATLLAAGSALAAAPAFQKADASSFAKGPKAPAMKQMAKAPARAAGGNEAFDFTYAYSPYTAYTLGEMNYGVDRVFLGFELTREEIKAFAGSKVTGFTVYSPTDNDGTSNGMTEGSFFLSTDPYLRGADYAQDFRLSAEAFAENKVDLAEAYTITGDEPILVFGYSMPIQKDMYYVVVDDVPNNPTTGILSVTQDGGGFPTQWQVFGDLYGALCMAVTLEGKDFPQGMSFGYLPATMCIPNGESVEYSAVVKALSADPISSFGISYTLGGNEYQYVYDNSYPVPAGLHSLDLMLGFPALDSKLNEDVEFRVFSINGKPYDGPARKARVAVVDEMPVRQTLYEEYTSTSCGWCTRGFAALEYIKKNYPEFVTVSFHSEFQSPDPMQVTEDFPSDVSGFPSVMLNRQVSGDPYYGTETYGSFAVPVVGDILALNEQPTSWTVDVSHVWESEDILTVKAEVANMAGYADADFKIAYLLVADGLSGKTSTWAQTNYYYQYNAEANYVDELKAFCRRGQYGKSRVTGLVYNDVVVSPDGIHGIEGSIPASLEAGQKAEHTFSFDLSQISASLIPDRDRLRVVAAVIDPRGAVLNCAKDEVNDFTQTGVDGIVADGNAPVEFYNLNGMKIAQPTEGVFIRRQGGKAEKVLIR